MDTETKGQRKKGNEAQEGERAAGSISSFNRSQKRKAHARATSRRAHLATNKNRGAKAPRSSYVFSVPLSLCPCL